jgi:hypothetical protein
MLGKENTFFLQKSPTSKILKKSKPAPAPATSINSSTQSNFPVTLTSPLTSQDLSLSNSSLPTNISTQLKRTQTKPLREIKKLDELNNRISPCEKLSNQLDTSSSSKPPKKSLIQQYQTRYDLSQYLKSYMVKPGFLSSRPRDSSKSSKSKKSISKNFNLKLNDLDPSVSPNVHPNLPNTKITPRKLFSKNVLDDPLNEYNSTIEDDTDTSINSVPTSRQLPNTSRTRNYWGEDEQKSVQSLSTLENESFRMTRRTGGLQTQNSRYTPIKCSLTELELSLQPDTNFG